MNKYLKLLGLNLSVIAGTIICYSSGLLALSPMDDSIFKAGMSIISGLGLATVFGVGNYKLLQNTSISAEALKNAFDETLQALDDISAYKQEALPRMKETIETFNQLAQIGEQRIQNMEKSGLL